MAFRCSADVARIVQKSQQPLQGARASFRLKIGAERKEGGERPPALAAFFFVAS